MAAHGHLKGGDSPPLLCSGGTPPVELPPALGPPGHEENGADRASGKEATEMLQGLQPLCSGKGWECWECSPGEEKAPGRP